MWVFHTYFTPGLGKMYTVIQCYNEDFMYTVIQCYNEDFMFLIKYFSAKHYSFDRSTFLSQQNLVASDYGIKIVHIPTSSEGGYFL